MLISCLVRVELDGAQTWASLQELNDDQAL